VNEEHGDGQRPEHGVSHRPVGGPPERHHRQLLAPVEDEQEDHQAGQGVAGDDRRLAICQPGLPRIPDQEDEGRDGDQPEQDRCAMHRPHW
jgi:hypothetical protein